MYMYIYIYIIYIYAFDLSCTDELSKSKTAAVYILIEYIDLYIQNKCFEYFNQILERYYEVHFLVNVLAENLQ